MMFAGCMFALVSPVASRVATFMATDDYAKEAVPSPDQLLGMKIFVATEDQVQTNRDKMFHDAIFGESTVYLHSDDADDTLQQAAEFLDANSHNPATVNGAILRTCRDDINCKWIWTTSPLLAGLDIRVTRVMGYWNTSVAGNRCHGMTQDKEMWCHKVDASLQQTRGRAFVMEGVPISSPQQAPLPVASVCHSTLKAQDINPSFDPHAMWCHLMIGREFLVVPQDHFVQVDPKEEFMEPAKKDLNNVMMGAWYRYIESPGDNGTVDDAKKDLNNVMMGAWYRYIESPGANGTVDDVVIAGARGYVESLGTHDTVQVDPEEDFLEQAKKDFNDVMMGAWYRYIESPGAHDTVQVDAEEDFLEQAKKDFNNVMMGEWYRYVESSGANNTVDDVVTESLVSV